VGVFPGASAVADGSLRYPNPMPDQPTATSKPARKPPPRDPITIGGTTVAPGTMQRIQIPVANLPTQTPINLPVSVVHGRRPGHTLWLSAAIHGDELNGLEIISRVLDRLDPKRLRGTVIAVPIVNVFGFLQQQRYLPDRRDLNRSFPGTAQGSLAARLAHLFITEIVDKSTHGLDLHTASNHRTNLPQTRADLTDPETRNMAELFGAPVMIHGEAPQGSLRWAVARRGKPIVVFEAGEPQRYNDEAVRVGVRGVMRVIRGLDMLRQSKPMRTLTVREAEHTKWVRARRSGMLKLLVKLGDTVTAKQSLGTINDAFGGNHATITSPSAGHVIGHTNNPLVNQGDAIIHLAQLKS